MRALPLALLLVGGCTCATSHGPPDGSPREDAWTAPLDVGPDARVDGGPAGSCEDVFASPDAPRGCDVPGATESCGRERCCQLVVQCSASGALEPVAYRDGAFHPGEIACTNPGPDPRCAVAAPNAMLEVSIGDREIQLTHAYASHAVGFGTFLGLTFTTTGDADVCTAQRLGIAMIAPDLEATSGAYVGEHEVRAQLADDTLDPPWRFATGRLTITESLGFREGGPIAGTLEIDDGDVIVRGSFRALECEPWQTSGS